MSASYQEFLGRKAISDPATGMDVIPRLPPMMFQFQRDTVSWLLRRGRGALFAGTGLGKSLMELTWGNAVAEHTGAPVLLLTPLAVAAQMVREGEKFGVSARQVDDQAGIAAGVNVTNYAKMHRFDLSRFGGVVLDESSILKSFNGTTRNELITRCRHIPFRLAATATPAPNDFMELGNHAEFVGAMTYAEMLAMFFVHDGGDTSKWRLKGHAEGDFWRWMCSWAVMMRRPSDLGYKNDGYVLPPLRTHQHTVAVEYRPNIDAGTLFPIEANTMQERIAARRASVLDRVRAAADLVNGNDRQWVCWCQLNDESELLAKSIPGAVELCGSDKENVKERKILDFTDGRIRVIVTKPSLAGFGLNWQQCRDTVFVGLNDSFEQVFQSIRRFWRFGQTQAVNVHFIASEMEGAVVSNLRRKEEDAERMAEMMVAHMSDLSSGLVRGVVRDRADYQPSVPMLIPDFMRAA
jgi:hypothetical protein